MQLNVLSSYKHKGHQEETMKTRHHSLIRFYQTSLKDLKHPVTIVTTSGHLYFSFINPMMMAFSSTRPLGKTYRKQNLSISYINKALF